MRFPLYILILLFLASGCRFFKGDPTKNTTISGTTTIAVDETFKPVMEAEIELFKAIYGYAEIKAEYQPENSAITMLLNDSVQMIVAARMLREDEISLLNERKLFPKQLKVATDAIALVVHPSCKLSRLSMKQLRQVLTGQIVSWHQLDPAAPALPIKLLFDHERSGIVRFLSDSICQGNFSASQASAMEFNREVIDYTATHPEVIGFVGTSWISNRNDSLHLSFHQKIKVLAISESDDPTSGNSYKPYQAYLLDKMYPLTRSIYMINAEPRSGLATGLVSFVAGDKGQRIILKSGLVPAVAPSRVVNIRTKL